ncbi:MAG TPA: bifunctional riboflavin kinase/FAD synthetase [Burkholderiales bacterium]
MVVTHGMPRPGRGRGAMTIGNFDGVHLGHQAMLSRVVAEARRTGLAAGLLTFEPHPREFFAPARAPARLSRMREKFEQFAAAGLDWVHVARFDARFAALSPARFLDEVLLKGLEMAWLLVGQDFRYGAKRAGDYAALEAASRLRGFGLEAMPDVQVAGRRASSSSVREALERGDFARAEALLGRPYGVSGRVVRGARLGRELGFPTANLRLPHRPPLGGIYVVEVQGARPASPQAWLPGVASYGRRPTVNALAEPLLEVHLFDFDDELYGRHLRVRFRDKLRDEEKYADLDALRAAIARDARRALDYFAKHHD